MIGFRQEHPFQNPDGCGQSLGEEARKRFAWVFMEIVDYRYPVHAADGAIRGARFDGVVFVFEMGRRVLIQRNRGIAALLGTIMDQSIFTDVEVAAAGMTMPLVRKAASEVVLELAV